MTSYERIINLFSFRGLLLTVAIVWSLGKIQAQAPTWQWAEEQQSNSQNEAHDVVVDTATHHQYVVGMFEGVLAAEFPIGVNNTPDMSAPFGNRDGWVAKYDVNGNAVWAFKIGSSGSTVEVNAVEIDVSGNIYITGYFNGTNVNFAGVTTSLNIQKTTAGGDDIFIAKYDPNGNLQWVIQGGSTLDDVAEGIAVNSTKVFVTGRYDGLFSITDAFSTVVVLPNHVDFDDVFVVAVGQNGAVSWQRSAAGSTADDESGYAISANDQHVFVGGDFENNVTFYDAIKGNQALSPFMVGSTSIFLAGYNAADGGLNWVDRVGSNRDCQVRGLDLAGANIYFTGGIDYTAGGVTFPGLPPVTFGGGGGREIFTAKIDTLTATRTTAWATVELCSGTPAAGGEDIIVSKTGEVYVTGFFRNNCSFNSGSNTQSSIGNSDVFVVEYDINGAFQWVETAESTGPDMGWGVGYDNVGGVYCSGTFDNGCTFGSLSLPNTTNLDGFHARLFICTNPIAGAMKVLPDTICLLDSINVFLVGYTGSIQWQTSTNKTTWTNMPGGTTDSVWYQPAASLYYRAMVSNGCGNDSTAIDSVEVVFYSSGPNAGVDDTICSSTYVLAGNNPGTANGLWKSLDGGTVTFPANPASGVTGMVNGRNRFVWEFSNGFCPALQDTVVIIVDSMPTINAGPDASVCATSHTMTAVSSFGNGNWNTVVGPASVAPPTSPLGTASPLQIGLNSLEWVVTNGMCTARDTVVITLDTAGLTPYAGPDDTLCSSSYTLAGSNPGLGVGLWTTLGSGTITTPGAFNSGVTGMGDGANVFIWTVTQGGCVTLTDTVRVIVDSLPTVAAVANDDTLCASSYPMSANPPLVGTGLWTTLQGPGAVAPANAPGGIAAGLGLGQNAFEWSITNGTCPPSRDTIVLIVDSVPVAANAGPNDTLCAPGYTFSANAPPFGVTRWSNVNSPAVVTPNTSPTATATGMKLGRNVFEWAIANGTCPPSRDTVVIFVDSVILSNAGPDDTLCVFATGLNGNPVPSGQWNTISGGATVTPPTSNTGTASGMAKGQNVFEWVVFNGTCPDSRDTVIVIVDSLPTVANAGPDDTICNSSYTFTANTPTVGGGAWNVITAGVGIAPPTQPTATATLMQNGQNIFEWTITNGTCPSSRDTIVIIVDSLPTAANAGLDDTICSSTYTLGGNIPGVGTGQWSGVGGSSITTPTSPTSATTGMHAGQHVYYWTITNGTCPPSSDTVVIQVDSLPAAPNAGPDDTICGAVFGPLQASVPTIGSGLWTGVGTFTNPNNPNSMVNGLIGGSNMLYWSVRNGVCPSQMDSVMIFSMSRPVSVSITTSVGNDTLCGDSLTLFSTLPGTATGLWSTGGASTIGSPTAPTTSITGMPGGTNMFVWTLDNGYCTNSDTILITRMMPFTTSAGPDAEFCGLDYGLQATALVGTGTWQSALNVSYDTPGSPNDTARFAGGGVYVLTWIETDGFCSDTDQVVLTIHEEPDQAYAGPDQTLSFVFDTDMDADPASAGQGSWKVIQGLGAPVSYVDEKTEVNHLSIGENIFAWTIANGNCPVKSDTVVVTVEDMFIPNGFSPNDDGDNDEFVVHGLTSYGNKVTIFNRWGKVVFERTDYQNDWDGTAGNGNALPDDTYYYVIELPSLKLEYTGYLELKK